jgi:glyoxylate/hydroxypyruvate reductase A
MCRWHEALSFAGVTTMKPPVLLLALFQVETDPWVAALRAAEPALEIRVWPVVGAVAEIDYALVWKQPPGILADLPNLKAIFSMGAGVENLLLDNSLPDHLPLVRMVDPTLVSGMVEFVVLGVLAWHRSLFAYREQQTRHLWQPLPQLPTGHRRVGLLGLGELGAASAHALVTLGFDVAGWSRTAKTLPGMHCFHGADGLDAMLARSDILVCLLPLTPDTRGILNRHTLGRLPRGACLINAARGGHLVEDDLIPLLDSGQLSAAMLDVFAVEPLPVDHPFWDHPAITLLPHAAAATHPATAAQIIAANIKRDRSGLKMENLVDRSRGY